MVGTLHPGPGRSASRRLRFLGFALFALILGQGIARATIFTVNDPGDTDDVNPGDDICQDSGGKCTLRAAIEEVNALGSGDTIKFAGAYVISLASALPAVSANGLTIDGYSAPGASANSAGFGSAGNAVLKVELTESTPVGDGLTLSGSSILVQGLVIRGFVSGAGIHITGGSGNHVGGCYLGTNVTGSSADANGVGVLLDGGDNHFVGDMSSNALRNVISGNSGAGIEVVYVGSTTVAGNVIGKNAALSSALPNGEGILLHGGAYSTTVCMNLIRDNTGPGIELDDGNTTGNSITENTIQSNGVGILIANASSFNTIGDLGGSDGNQILSNAGGGVVIVTNGGSTGVPPGSHPLGITSTETLGNIVYGNTFSSNGKPGLNLTATYPATDGVTANDAGDSDTGANNFQNFPVVSSAVLSAPDLDVTFSVDSSGVPATNSLWIQIYKTDPSDGTSNPQGKDFLGGQCFGGNSLSGQVMTVPGAPVSVGDKIVATATSFADSTCGNVNDGTSEFSAFKIVTGSGADLSIVKSPSANPVAPGASFSYILGVTNSGPGAASSVAVTDVLPSSLTFVSAAGSGWSCGFSAGTVTCTQPSLAVGSSTITLNVIAPGAAGTITNTASVSASTADPKPGNNQSTSVVAVGTFADVAVTKTGPSTFTPGDTLTFTITATNLGSDPADGVVVSDPTPAGLTFVSNSGDCATPFPCNLGSLSPGQTSTIVATYHLPVDYSGSPTITNTALISSNTSDSDASNDVSSVTVTLNCSRPQGFPVVTPVQQYGPGQPISVDWTDTDVVASFLVEVSSNASFTPVLRSFTIPYDPAALGLYHETFALDDPGTYYVRVSAVSACGRTEGSPVAAVEVAPPPARVIASLFPAGMVQQADLGGATDAFALTNVGGVATTISLSQSGNFFTEAPGSFTLPPLGSQIVNIAGLGAPAGTYAGLAIPSGAGVPATLRIPVSLLSLSATTGAGTVSVNVNRIDVSGDPETNPVSSVTLFNNGSSPVRGLLIADVLWIRPQTDPISIPAGGSATGYFQIIRSLRPDAGNLEGTVSGSLSFLYTAVSSSGVSALSLAPEADTSSGGSVTKVSVNDTVQPPVSQTGIPPLSASEVAFYVPGVGHVTSSSGVFQSDVSVANDAGAQTLSDVQFYYTPARTCSGVCVSSEPGFRLGLERLMPEDSGSVQKVALPTISPNQSLDFADMAKVLFGASAQTGTLQIRTANWDKISINGNVFNVSNPKGTYGTSIPVFRSDRAVSAGASLFITGLRRDATTHTNLYIQETSGSDASVETDFLDVNGNVVGSRQDTVPAFNLLQLLDPVPEGAVAARVTNASSTGRIAAYATPVDEVSGDSWSVVDWNQQYGFSATEPVLVPVAGVTHGANGTFFHTDLAITNTSSSPASGTLRYYETGGAVHDETITLDAGASSILADVVASVFGVAGDSVGYLVFTPASGSFAVTSRTYTTVSGSAATYGTSAPTLALSSGLSQLQTKRIAGLEDSSSATVAAAIPGTFRTNVGLVETAGGGATVRATLLLSDGTKLGSADFTLAPHQFMLIQSLGEAILGPSRDSSFGDLHNLQVFFEVVDGAGAVVPFVSSVDNGTGDSVLRTE